MKISLKYKTIVPFLYVIYWFLPPVMHSYVQAQQIDQVLHSEFAVRYIEAFNSGDTQALADLSREIYTADYLSSLGGPVPAAWFRMELFRTYGPLVIEYTDTHTTPPIIWTRGNISDGWIGHQLYLSKSKEKKIIRHSIWRPRPVPYPNTSLSVSQVAEKMKQYLHLMSDAGHFSGSVTISFRGNEVLNDSWGYDGQYPPTLITHKTRFHIASVTKLFTITALLQFVEEGIITLEDKIGKWIPNYPQPYRDSVTIRHLLTHTSGIELDDDVEYLNEIRVANTATDLLRAQIRSIEKQVPPFPSSSEYDYTSEGVDLLGIIMEHASGKLWTDIVQERILKPAGMKYTRFSVPETEGMWALGKTSLNPDLQTTSPGALRSALDVLPIVAKPSSGIWSTAEDLNLFMNAVINNKLLSSAWTDSLLTPYLETGELEKYGIKSWIGMGAQGEDLWGIRTVGHGGVVPGYSAAIEYLPEKAWLLTVVSNTGEATGFLVFQKFLELVGHFDD